MEPYAEHAFYAWIIILAAVFIAAFVGAMIWRIRFMRAHHDALVARRRHACELIMNQENKPSR